ncbi:MAG: DUF1343 domain-containing protein [Gemmataceae bacterium]
MAPSAVTNHTGVDADGVSAIDTLRQGPRRGSSPCSATSTASAACSTRGWTTARTRGTGLPVYSLYGKNRRPTRRLRRPRRAGLRHPGRRCRFYTYSTTLGYVLEEGRTRHPRRGAGPASDRRRGGRGAGAATTRAESFVAYHPVPVRHGMTFGSTATLFNAERKLDAKLEVVKVENWRRGDLYDRTGLVWRNPSPNMRSLTAALLYPGVGLLETTNLSVGRGTDRPFEQLGAPWIDGRQLAESLNAEELPGVRFVPTRFTPASSVHERKECGGVQIYVTDWSRFESLPTGFAIATDPAEEALPEDWQTRRYNVLLANQAAFDAVEKGQPWRALLKLAEPGRKAFLEVRKRYSLYD